MTADVIIDIIVRWALPTLMCGLVSVASARYGAHKADRKRDAERDAAIGTGLQCLLRAEIIRCAEKYHDKGYCPIYAREALKRAYDSYHNLGGNDVATDLYHRTMALPSDPEREDA